MMRFTGWLGAVVVLLGVAAPSAIAEDLGCGAEVTTDVVLSASLTGCSTGLIVAADGITIDLNGYAIEGVGADSATGIEAADRVNVTIKNGHVRGFQVGVRLLRTR